MTRTEEIAAMRALLGDLRAFRAGIDELTHGPAKAALLARADAVIAKAELSIARLEHPSAPLTASLSQPTRVQ